MKAKKRKAGSRSDKRTRSRSGSVPGKSRHGPEGIFQYAWSRRIRQTFKSMTDSVVLLIFLFFLIVVILVSGVAKNDQPRQEETAHFAGDRISGRTVAEAIGDAMEEDLADGTADMDYDLKRELGTDFEFVMHFEDRDGNVIEINGKPCAGSPQASVNGQKCS